jgi:phosphomevalonate kinase
VAVSETRTWSAPGKLFVSGEYAVLWGGVGRVVAVPPRTLALARRRDDGRVEVLLEGRRLEGSVTPQGVAWREPPAQAAHFVSRAIDLALRASPGSRGGFTVAFSPSPTSGGHKLGLGSSARAAVLATEATRWAVDAAFDTLKLALVAHAEAQGGRGSGGDVAAIFAGGTVAYRRYELAALLKEAAAGGLAGGLSRSGPVEVNREAPPALELIYVFTGQSASTPALIGQAERTLQPAQRTDFVRRSDELSAALQQALARGDLAVVREACDGLQALLDGLTSAPQPTLQRVLQLARASGCAAKQSGAGGGDGCLAFAPDADAASRLVETVEARGFLARRLEVAPGLRLEPAADPTLASWL